MSLSYAFTPWAPTVHTAYHMANKQADAHLRRVASPKGGQALRIPRGEYHVLMVQRQRMELHFIKPIDNWRTAATQGMRHSLEADAPEWSMNPWKNSPHPSEKQQSQSVEEMRHQRCQTFAAATLVPRQRPAQTPEYVRLRYRSQSTFSIASCFLLSAKARCAETHYRKCFIERRIKRLMEHSL